MGSPLGSRINPLRLPPPPPPPPPPRPATASVIPGITPRPISTNPAQSSSQHRALLITTRTPTTKAHPGITPTNSHQAHPAQMPILASRLTSGARFFHDREGICPHFGDKILRDHGNDSAVGHSGAMSYDIPGAAAPIAQSQSGAVSRQQLLRAGIASKLINARLKRRRWQQLHWGVYAVFTGPVPRQTELWAVLLRAGPGAALSHLTAAELHGLCRFPR